MFLKKAAIMTLSTLFLTVGCTTTSQPTAPIQDKTPLIQDQTATITTLETTLAQTKVELEKAQKETAELNAKLKKQMATIKEDSKKSSNVVVEKVSKQDSYQDKTVLGQAEWIYITKAKQNFKARIDTGATTSSINAVDIERFERDGKKWVRFNITHNKDGNKEIIEAPVLRIAKIVQSSKPGVETERPVVKLHVRIGDVVHQSEFTLTNRLHMEFPVLIGRTFMQDVVLVDVSQDYIHPKYQAKTKK